MAQNTGWACCWDDLTFGPMTTHGPPPLMEIYRRKVVYPMVTTLRSLNKDCVKSIVLQELLRLLLPTTLYITYTALGKMQLWYGTPGDGTRHVYTCPLVRHLPTPDATGFAICWGDAWVAACNWDGHIYAATRSGMLVRAPHAAGGGDTQSWTHVGRSILHLQVAMKQLWVCTDEGVVLAYSRELRRLVTAYPSSRWYGCWAWTMAVGAVPYIAHRDAMRVYSWNQHLDKGTSWNLPPEVTNHARSRDCGVTSMAHCWTASGQSLLVTALIDSYQIWDVCSVGGPGHLLMHHYLEHYVQCLAFAWDLVGQDPGDAGALRFFQHWRDGYYVYSYGARERPQGGLSLLGSDPHFVVRDASFQCFRHEGHWVTISQGLSPPALRLETQLNTGCIDTDWATAEGRVAETIGFQGWTLDVASEAARAARAYPDSDTALESGP